MPTASIELPTTVWSVFPFGKFFLFVTAPMPDTTNDSYASLHFWSPSFKSPVTQCRLMVDPSWRPKGYLPQGAQRLQPFLGPDYKNLILPWIYLNGEVCSYSVTVNLSTIYMTLKTTTNPLVVLEPLVQTTLIKHPMSLQKTTFLTPDIAVTGKFSKCLQAKHEISLQYR